MFSNDTWKAVVLFLGGSGLSLRYGPTIANNVRNLVNRGEAAKITGVLGGAGIIILLGPKIVRKISNIVNDVIHGETPNIFHHPSRSEEEILRNIPELVRFKPAFWAVNGHASTIISSWIRQKTPNVNYVRESIVMADGGTISLDWAYFDESSRHKNVPTLLIAHGLVGNSQEGYILSAVFAAHSKGWNAVVFNARGCGGNPLTTPKGNCGAFTSDIRTVVTLVQKKAPGRIYAVGYSLGAGILSKYLGEEQDASPLSGAVAQSASFNFHITTQTFPLYSRHLAGNLKDWVKKHESILRTASKVDLDHVYQARNLREFDSRLTVPIFGFKDVDHYYTEASAGRVLHQVKIPLLCLNSKDDPVCAAKGIPYHVVQENNNIILVTTKYGGHIAWCEGVKPAAISWADRVMMEFFELLERNHGS